MGAALVAASGCRYLAHAYPLARLYRALPSHQGSHAAVLYASDLIELNGDDLRRDPLEVRKATLASVLAGVGHGIWFNDHIEADGPTVFAHACKMGLEGIVSKRKDFFDLIQSGQRPDR